MNYRLIEFIESIFEEALNTKNYEVHPTKRALSINKGALWIGWRLDNVGVSEHPAVDLHGLRIDKIADEETVGFICREAVSLFGLELYSKEVL